MPRTVSLIALLALPAAALALTGCGSSSSANGSGGSSKKLTLVAYSTPKEAYSKLIPAFDKTSAGKGVSFDQSYGASGEQSRAVEGGLHADVVAFSLEPDVSRLVKAGLVSKSWNSDAYHGMVTDSVAVLAVRKGNPKHITGWDDLVKPGIQVITPNPFTSGGARWNVMAAYGAQLQEGRTPAQAIDYLRKLFQHVPVQDKSARESLQTFAGGKGDVMIAYENEAITAQRKGVALQYLIPPQTILIENPIAVTSDSKDAKTADAFVSWLRTDPAQKIFAAAGYRPVVKRDLDSAKFPAPKQLFTIDKLGGWKVVKDKFFDPSKGIVAGIERKLGVSTASG